MPALRAAFFAAVPLLVLASAALAGELPFHESSSRYPLFCLAAEHSRMSPSAGSASTGKSQAGGGTGGGGGSGGGGGEHPSQSRADSGTGWGGGGGYPVYGGFPGMYPGFHTLDRLYAEMMDNVDRVRAEMERLSYSPFGVGAAYLPALGGGPSTPALRAGASGNLPLATTGGGVGGRGGGGGAIMPYYRGGSLAPFYSSAFNGGGMMLPFGRGGGGGAVVPRVDFQDAGNEYVLEADLPGIDKNNVKVQVHNGILHLSGEQHQETKDQQKGYFMQERYQSSFSRSLPLPENVQEDQIRATMKDGVLQVHLPKIPSEKSNIKKVNVE